jgi:hypothetical protein
MYKICRKCIKNSVNGPRRVAPKMFPRKLPYFRDVRPTRVSYFLSPVLPSRNKFV